MAFLSRKEDVKTDIWQKYEDKRDLRTSLGHFSAAERAHRFYEGDQWRGVKAGGEDLPFFNFIKPIVRYKSAVVSQNTMSAVFSPLEIRSEQDNIICDALTQYFAAMWEVAKMDSLSWKVIKDACIAGSAYVFFGEGDDLKRAQMIDTTNIFFSDEKEADIQAQSYIIIRERCLVSDVRAEAEKKGLSKEEINLIVSDDEDFDCYAKERPALKSEGRVLCLLYLYRDEKGFIHSVKSTKKVIYSPDTPIVARGKDGECGLKLYPVVSFLWEDKKGSGRGLGEVEGLINNQLEVNKTLARRAISVKQGAYPRLAYSKRAVRNPDELDRIGGKIAVDDAGSLGVSNVITFLSPAGISPDARELGRELIATSRELAGAGEAAMGSIDPTQASGAAIIAVRDQSALPLNEQVARYRQFTEDLALLWLDMLTAYNPNGIELFTGGRKLFVTGAELMRLKVNVRIDVSQNNPFSRYAREQAIEKLFTMGAITFEEYVNALSEDSSVPRAKLLEILKAREKFGRVAAQNVPKESTLGAAESIGNEREGGN